MAESLYETLGVSKTATADEIRKAYRKLARELHPDVNPGDDAAEDRFKAVSAAYEVLSDADKRQAYDEFGEESLRGGFDADKARAYQSWKSSRRRSADPFQQARRAAGPAGPGRGGFADFDLSDLFGSAWTASGPMRGPDAYATVDMTLRQAIQGGEVELKIPDRKPIKVRIPPGADTGSIIRIPGKGLSGHEGGEPGDLVIETRVKPHPLVRRDGLDLTLTLPITLAEAYLGAELRVPTFDAPVVLKIPPRSQPGQKLRLRGKGVSRKGPTRDRRGDLYIELDVRLPDRDDPDLAAAIREHDKSSRRDVRAGMKL
jgi:DnaJ-class molecular chaperone